MKRFFLVIIMVGCLVIGLNCAAHATMLGGANVSQKREVGPEWLSFSTRYLTVIYHPDVNLRVVNKRISLYFRDITLDRERPQNSAGDAEAVAFKFDKMLRKVKETLDMRPICPDLTIQIFKNQQQLNDHFYAVFGRPNSSRIISYYIHAHKTIYTSEWAIRTDVLAHEMAHAVIRHYFLVRPPTNVDELMAQYVERHLHD